MALEENMKVLDSKVERCVTWRISNFSFLKNMLSAGRIAFLLIMLLIGIAAVGFPLVASALSFKTGHIGVGLLYIIAAGFCCFWVVVPVKALRANSERFIDEWLYVWFAGGVTNLIVAVICAIIAWVVFVKDDYESNSTTAIQLTILVHFSICIFYPCALASGIALSTPMVQIPIYHLSHPQIEVANEKQKDHAIIVEGVQDSPNLEA
jgi:hypothetical protein